MHVVMGGKISVYRRAAQSAAAAFRRRAARVLLAQLMLQPADVLLLDEPTNDLDIPTLRSLERLC